MSGPAPGTEVIARSRKQFPGARGYLDTATLGLPSQAVLDELHAALDAWRDGRATAPGYDAWVDRARSAYARLTGVDVARVAIAAQASACVGVVAASLPAGSEVLCPTDDFTSVSYPFLVQRDRGVRVRFVPLAGLADAVTEATDLVAFSAVQSRDGTVADVDAITEAARRHGARTLVDATQGCGWLALDHGALDVVVCSAYKWLLSPRGVCFMTVADATLARLTPHLAGWYAAEDPWRSLYGDELALAGNARRLDVSPAWHAWVGAAPALELLADLGVEAIGAHSVGLAERLRDRLGLPSSRSAVVSVALPDAPRRLTEVGVRAATRGDRVRFSFYLYNDEADVDAVVRAVEGADR